MARTIVKQKGSLDELDDLLYMYGFKDRGEPSRHSNGMRGWINTIVVEGDSNKLAHERIRRNSWLWRYGKNRGSLLIVEHSWWSTW